MADNIELDAGTGGAVIATDDDATAHHQYVKVEFGPDNTQTKVTASVGLPVKILTGTAEIGKLAAGTAEIGNVKNAGTFATQATLQAGSNTIGKLAANSGVDIGDVDVISSALPTGAATAAKQLADGHNVTIDNAGGVEVVQLTAGDLNCTEASAAGILTDTGVIASDTTSIDGKITACDTGAVVITTLPRSQIGPAEPGTAVDSYTQKAINLTTGADQVLVASAANKQIWVYGYQFTCGTADGQSVSFQDELDVELSGVMKFAQYGGASVAPSGNFSMPIWKLGTDKDLEIDIVGGDVDGWITYAILSV